MGAAEVSTAAVVADFMEGAADSTAVEDFPAAVVLDLAVDIRLADLVVADLTEVAASMVAAEVMVGAAEAMAGAAEVGVAATVTGEAGAGAAGAGDLATAGRIGDMAGDIRMATTATIRDTMRPILIRIPTRPTDIRRTT